MVIGHWSSVIGQILPNDQSPITYDHSLFVYLLTGKEPTDFEEDPRTGQMLWRSSATQVQKPLANLIDDLMQPFPGNRPKNTDEILQRIDKISRELYPPVPPPQPPQPPQSQRNLTTSPPKNNPGAREPCQFIAWRKRDSANLLAVKMLY